MDFSQIQELIRMLSKHKISEFILTEGDFKLVIRNHPAAPEQPAPLPVAQPVLIPAAQPVMAAPQPAAVPVITQAPASAETPAFSAEKPAAPAETASEKLVAVKSPMVGTFYRSPAPDKPPFVKVGDTIDVGSTVCIIEAMKLFNEIESEVKGRIVKVGAEDASPVEYDQVLFWVDPA